MKATILLDNLIAANLSYIYRVFFMRRPNKKGVKVARQAVLIREEFPTIPRAFF